MCEAMKDMNDIHTLIAAEDVVAAYIEKLDEIDEPHQYYTTNSVDILNELAEDID